MEEPICPFCDKKQTSKPTKSWEYGSSKVKVERYVCQCDNSFGYYKSAKNAWTIPKKKK